MVEILIGMGLISILGMALMSVFGIHEKNQSAFKKKRDISVLVNSIKNDISSETACLNRISIDTTTLNSLDEAGINYRFPEYYIRRGETLNLKLKEITPLGIQNGENFYRGLISLYHLHEKGASQQFIGVLFFKVNGSMTMTSCHSGTY